MNKMKGNNKQNKEKLIYAIVFALIALVVILLLIPSTRFYLVGIFGYAAFAYVIAAFLITLMTAFGRTVSVSKRNLALYISLFVSFLTMMHVAFSEELIEGGWNSYILGAFSSGSTAGGFLLSVLTCVVVVPMGYLASLIVFLVLTGALGLMALWPLLVKRDPNAPKKPFLMLKNPEKKTEVREEEPSRTGIYVGEIGEMTCEPEYDTERQSPDYVPESPKTAAERILFENGELNEDGNADIRRAEPVDDGEYRSPIREYSDYERTFFTRQRPDFNDNPLFYDNSDPENVEKQFADRYGRMSEYGGNDDFYKTIDTVSRSERDTREEPQETVEPSFRQPEYKEEPRKEEYVYDEVREPREVPEPTRSSFAEEEKIYIPKPVIKREESLKVSLEDAERRFVEQSVSTVKETPAPRAEVRPEVRKPEPAPEPKEPPKKPKRPYTFPPVDLLPKGEYCDPNDIEDYGEKKNIINQTLASFGISAEVTGAVKGPSVTRYELKLEEGVLVKKIENIVDNLAMRLKVSSVRVLAPIKGKDAVGLEIPNKKSTPVMLRDIINSQEFNMSKGNLVFGVGKTVENKNFVADLASAPHMLVAGQTGSGKSVCINSILISFLYRYAPDELKLILIDPKQVELASYCNLPHMLIPQTLDSIPQAINAIKWLCEEMDRRYKFLRSVGSNNIEYYNKNIRKPDEPKLPRIVLVMDEMADFMLRAKNQIEDPIVRLASLGRAAGIHMILATQRPSAEVITGLIKTNIPTTIAFAVRSGIDSQVILGPGEIEAKDLLGKGDMFFKSQSLTDNLRLQCAFIDLPEVIAVTQFIKANNDCEYDDKIDAFINPPPPPPEETVREEKEQAQELDYERLCIKVLRTFIMRKKASVSLIQQVHGVGFNKASRIFNTISEWGVISEYDGSQKPRRVLIDMDAFNRDYAPRLEEEGGEE